MKPIILGSSLDPMLFKNFIFNGMPVCDSWHLYVNVHYEFCVNGRQERVSALWNLQVVVKYSEWEPTSFSARAVCAPNF